jgi:hypothetical protein
MASIRRRAPTTIQAHAASPAPEHARLAAPSLPQGLPGRSAARKGAARSARTQGRAVERHFLIDHVVGLRDAVTCARERLVHQGAARAPHARGTCAARTPHARDDHAEHRTTKADRRRHPLGWSAPRARSGARWAHVTSEGALGRLRRGSISPAPMPTGWCARSI